jgi:hypothetical protein
MTTHLQTESANHTTTPADSGYGGRPDLYIGSFSACLAAEMAIYKLGGFVTDHNGELVEVTPERVVVRLGHRRMFPLFRGPALQRPIEIEVRFGDDIVPTPGSRRTGATRVEVTVSIRPVGWNRDEKQFEDRARELMRTIREYFMADQDQAAAPR